MAKKKEDKKQHKNEDSFIRKVINFFKDERTHFVVGLLFVMFGVYLFISFMSFFYTGDADQSKLENLSLAELSSVKNDIQNWTGALGAYLSNLFINQWVGVSSFVICIFVCAIGLKLMKVKQVSVIKWICYTCAIVILGSLICGFFLSIVTKILLFT